MNSYWVDTTQKNQIKYTSLNKNITVDVCIIGAGLTGITSAYYLSNSNLNVALIEQDSICTKVSGNSTGKITSQHNLIYNDLINSYGKSFAKNYLQANEEAVKRIKEIITNENIDCDFSSQDNYVYAANKNDLEKVKQEVEAVTSLGLNCKFVTKIPLNIPNYGAIQFPNQGQFNPRKYALTLCKIASNNGVEIYTHTKVNHIEQIENSHYSIETNHHTIKAKYVILASHYPILNFPGFYFLKMYQSMSHVIAVDAKTDLPDGMYINVQGNTPTYSFRAAPFENKKLLIVAGSDHKTGEKISLTDVYTKLEEKARELFPQSECLYRWCAEDCIPLDNVPYIGDFSSVMPNLFVATGFKKWGISFSNVASKIITDQILNIENPYTDTFKATRLEPIKNHKELGNMIKESVYSLVINKLKNAPDTLNDVEKDQGKIIELDGQKVGVYRDLNGECFFIHPVCAHLGCELSFNNIEKTWDCPCHGSRYDIYGKAISEPTTKDIEHWK